MLIGKTHAQKAEERAKALEEAARIRAEKEAAKAKKLAEAEERERIRRLPRRMFTLYPRHLVDGRVALFEVVEARWAQPTDAKSKGRFEYHACAGPIRGGL